MTESNKTQGQKNQTMPGIAGSTGTAGSAVVDQAKEVAGHVADQAKDLALSQVKDQQKKSAGDLGNVAHALRETSRQLDGNLASPYVDKAADQVERIGDFLKTANLRDITDGVESFARREPALFLGGAFALGILGARFLKSSGHRDAGRGASGGMNAGMNSGMSSGSSSYRGSSVSSSSAQSFGGSSGGYQSSPSPRPQGGNSPSSRPQPPQAPPASQSRSGGSQGSSPDPGARGNGGGGMGRS